MMTLLKKLTDFTRRMLAYRASCFGAGLLDEKRPGWASQIDLNRLYIQRMDCCVLAQLYGSFYAGEDKLHLSYDRPHTSCYYGFRARSMEDERYLNLAWRRRVENRLKAATKVNARKARLAAA